MTDDPDLIVCYDCGYGAYDPSLFTDDGKDGPVCAYGCGPESVGEEQAPQPRPGTIGGPR